MPLSETINQDLQLALAVPLAALMLLPFWMGVYVPFEDSDEALFDDTFTNGINATELYSWVGVVDNVAAQSSWRCIMLIAIHLLCTAYPMSASALCAGGLLLSGFHTDAIGALMAGILFVIAIYETVWDDDNGVGIWHLVNSALLLIFTLPRLFYPVENSRHVLMRRPCYQEQEVTKEQEITDRGGDISEAAETSSVV